MGGVTLCNQCSIPRPPMADTYHASPRGEAWIRAVWGLVDGMFSVQFVIDARQDQLVLSRPKHGKPFYFLHPRDLAAPAD